MEENLACRVVLLQKGWLKHKDGASENQICHDERSYEDAPFKSRGDAVMTSCVC